MCVQQKLIVSIPNALYIGGLNPYWKPIVNIDEFEEYKVSIYNRLGQLVYELEDYTQFWDGSYRSTGELSSSGVFIFLWNLKPRMGIIIIGKDISQLSDSYVFCFFFLAAGNNILFKINL